MGQLILKYQRDALAKSKKEMRKKNSSGIRRKMREHIERGLGKVTLQAPGGSMSVDKGC